MKKAALLSVLVIMSFSVMAQWGQVNTGLTNLSMGARLLGMSSSYLFAGTLGDAKMYRSNTNGANWVEINPPVTANVPECGFYFNGRYFAGLNASSDCIYYSMDDGSTWNPVTGAPTASVVRNFVSWSGNIYAYTSNAGIYRSTDGGTTWSTVNNGLTNLNVISVETINATLVAATIGGGIYTSTDNGNTWQQSNSGISTGDLSASLLWRMGTNLYLITQSGSSYTSSNEGVSWTNWVKPAAMGLAVMEVYRSGNLLLAESRHFSGGLRDSVYYSIDEGLSWNNITDNLSATDLNASGLVVLNNFIYIAYNIISPGLGIYSRGLTTGMDALQRKQDLILYPNPFNDLINISGLVGSKVVQVCIMNHTGQKVLEQTLENNLIVTGSLPQGMYYIQLMDEDEIFYCKKMIRL